MIRTLFTAALFAGLATGASATLYTCSVEEQGTRSGWIPPVVMVAVEASGNILVSDSVGAVILERPAEGALLNESQKTFSVRWQVAGALSATNQYASFLYTAIIDKQRGTIRVRAKPKGYSNVFNGTGRCRVGEIPR